VKFLSRRWRTALVALIAAFAVSLAVAGTASAAQPGESGNWAPETFNGVTPISTPLTMGEARQGLTIVDVWRGETDNHVWISENHGEAFQIGSTATNFAPTVVPWGSTRFMIFHVGTDNHIYYTWIDPSMGQEAAQGWVAVPGQTTTRQVSVTQLGLGDWSLYMVYRSSTDDRIWGTLFNSGAGDFPAQNSWIRTTNIGGGLSPSAPSVTYSPSSGRIYAAARGDDNQVYLNSANDLIFNWGTWEAEGGATVDQPTIAAAQNNDGDLLVSYRDTNSHINYGLFNEGGTFNGWQQDITNWQTLSPAFLSVANDVIYALVTGRDNIAYWKQVIKRSGS
jgi:hypothetical protein